MVISNVEGRVNWIPGLLRVEQDMPEVFIGSIHHCIFEKCHATVSPLNMTFTDEGIMYAEKCEIPEMDLHLNIEIVCTKTDDENCTVSWRFINTSLTPLPEETGHIFFDRMKKTMDELKVFCEKIKETFPEPLVK
ncbi:MAG TPA: hypothetical protein VFI33_20815, partial [Puia sp.]|nr:hypothetical protein [Puia sp.]